MNAPDKATPFTVHFDNGVPVKLEVEGKVITGSLEIFKEANEIGRINGEASELQTTEANEFLLINYQESDVWTLLSPGLLVSSRSLQSVLCPLYIR